MHHGGGDFVVGAARATADLQPGSGDLTRARALRAPWSVWRGARQERWRARWRRRSNRRGIDAICSASLPACHWTGWPSWSWRRFVRPIGMRQRRALDALRPAAACAPQRDRPSGMPVEVREALGVLPATGCGIRAPGKCRRSDCRRRAPRLAPGIGDAEALGQTGGDVFSPQLERTHKAVSREEFNVSPQGWQKDRTAGSRRRRRRCLARKARGASAVLLGALGSCAALRPSVDDCVKTVQPTRRLSWASFWRRRRRLRASRRFRVFDAVSAACIRAPRRIWRERDGYGEGRHLRRMQAVTGRRARSSRRQGDHGCL